MRNTTKQLTKRDRDLRIVERIKAKLREHSRSGDKRPIVGVNMATGELVYDHPRDTFGYH
jgi:hypothetical protein